jgi:hypothetical protein
MSRERIKDKYPMFFAYGGDHTFLDTEAARSADTETRIRSIWPFIVRRVLAFQQTLKPRDKVNFDPEDTLSELWIALAENDGEWSPERGKYITFAGVIIDRELCAIRDKARTVHSPRNSSCRMKEYKSEEEMGTISPRRLKTANDIRRTAEGIQPMTGNGPEFDKALDEEPVSTLTVKEMTEETIDAIKAAIRSALTTIEATVLGRLSGIWGNEPQTVWVVSLATARDQEEVRRIKARAWRKVREYLTTERHPAAVEPN